MSFLDSLRSANTNEGTVFIHKLNEYHTRIKPWTPTFRPSGLSYTFCPRTYALAFMGLIDTYEKIDAESFRRMDNGTAMHERYHKYTNEMDVVYRDERYGDPENEYRCEERTLEHPSGLVGHYDAIMDLGDEYLYLTDFKSIKQDKFFSLNEPYDYHRKQLVMYMGMVNDLYELDRPICGLYVYEGKSDQDLKEFKIPWTTNNELGFQELLRLIATVKEAVATQNPLIAPCKCRWKEKCQNWDLNELQRLKDQGKPKRVMM